MAEPEKSFTDYLKSYIGFDNKPETKIKQTNQLNIFEIPLGSTLGDANLNLESFTLPMSASGSDQKISEDDAGHPVFRSKLDGSTYTIMYKEDQRTDLTKFKEDVIPAVKEYADNPYLPTKEQVVDTTKAVAGSIYDTFSIPGDIASGKKSLSDVTYGDAYEIAGGSALATTPLKVPGGDSSNTLRMFGGVGMVGTGTSKNYKKAKKLLKKYLKSFEVDGYNPNQGDIDFEANKKIWEQTNWYVDPIDGQWRFYIDDSKSKLNSIEDVFKNNEITQSEIKGSKFKGKDGLETRLGDIFNHPELYKKYPNFRNLPVQFYDNPLSDNLGTASDGYVGINLANQKDVKSIRSTLLHEIQHVIQRREGFVRGSSDENIPVDLTDKKQIELDEKRKPFEIERDRLQNELNATNNSFERILLQNKEPLTGLTANQEVEIYKSRSQDPETKLMSGPSKSTLAKKYGVKPAQIDKAWARQNLTNNFRKEINQLNKKLLKISSAITRLDAESLRVDFEFYRGAGGEIESRLVQKMAKNTSGTTKFPLETRAEMLKKEDDIKGDKSEYRGKFGVDPLVYEIKPRREPNRETFLNRLRRESITRKRQKGRGYKYFEGGSVSTKTTAPVDTGNKTISGRTIWNDPETGEDYSERSTTFEINGKYYTMPTVSEDGRQYSEDQIRNYVKKNGPVDYITGEKLPEFRSMEDALEYAISRSSTRKKPAAGMSEGGSVNNMDNQMKVFEEGGIADDGMNRDPISGNEVPSGSLASEVRDNIPAQLSEGEYVVPADVVRYFGVRVFEDMRMEAKMGLQKMEQDGRIGGEPIDTPAVSSNTDDLSPEEQKLLQEIMAMEQPEEQPAGFAPGGYAGTLGSSYIGSDYATPKGFKSFADYVVSPTKVEDQFKTLGGSYLETGSTGMADSVAPVEPVVNKVCPPGQIFSEELQMCVVDPNASRGDNDNFESNIPEPKNDWGQNVDWTNPEAMTEYSKSVLTPMDPMISKGLQVAGIIAGGPIGLLIGSAPIVDAINDLSNARASALVARARGDTATADLIDTQIAKYIETAPAMATGALGTWFGSGTGRADQLAKRLGFKNLADAEANQDMFNAKLRAEQISINPDGTARTYTKKDFAAQAARRKAEDAAMAKKSKEEIIKAVSQNVTKDPTLFKESESVSLGLGTKAAVDTSKDRAAASRVITQKAFANNKIEKEKDDEGKDRITTQGVQQLKKAIEKEGGTWNTSGRNKGGLIKKRKKKK